MLHLQQLNFKCCVGETTVLWNITETGTGEFITYLLSYSEAQVHDVSGPSQTGKATICKTDKCFENQTYCLNIKVANCT